MLFFIINFNENLFVNFIFMKMFNFIIYFFIRNLMFEGGMLI